MFTKIIFLLVYFLLVFLVVRFLEFYVSSTAGSATILKYFYDRFPIILDGTFQNTCANKNHNKNNDNKKRTWKEKPNKFSAKVDIDDINQEIVVELSSYGDFIENVEDTKASIWVVNVHSAGDSQHILSEEKWRLLSRILHQYSIRTGSYSCKKDPWLCLQHKISTSTIILAMPNGSQPKGNVALYVYNKHERDNPTNAKNDIFNWVQSRLYRKVKTVHSISELTERPVVRRKNVSSFPSLSFIYHSDNHVPPLLLTALSVKFTGRIKFYMLKTEQKVAYGDTFAMTEFSTYKYGKHKGESFSYTCMELFLRTLHPEVNDVFIFSVVLLNMACWLELFLQKGGPLRRIFFYLWGFALTNVVLFSVWLPIIQLLYIPELQPIFEICLKSLQQMMFTNMAAIVRQDFLQISQHLHVVFMGFICYGVFIGYLRYKIRNDTSRSESTISLFDNDIQELNNLFRSLLAFVTPSLRVYRFEERIERILNRLATPDLWLHSTQSMDFMFDLPVWRHCNRCLDSTSHSSAYSSESEIYSDSDTPLHPWEEIKCLKCPSQNTDQIPDYVLPTQDCVICLGDYKCKELVSGLPCGHSFHKRCIEEWLLSGTGCNKNRCPICRWPADIRKGLYEIIDAAE